METKNVVILIGMTGGGKSACGNKLLWALEDNYNCTKVSMENDSSANAKEKVYLGINGDITDVDKSELLLGTMQTSETKTDEPCADQVDIDGQYTDQKSQKSYQIGIQSLEKWDELHFSEGGGSSSCTQELRSYEAGGVRVVDTPGLYDSGGERADAEHVRALLDYVRGRGVEHLNAVLLVLNAQQERLDRCLRDAVKLFLDSFGHGCAAHLGVVFTRAPEICVGNPLAGDEEENLEVPTGSMAERAVALRRLLAEELGVLGVPERLPYWGVDCHPERLATLGVPADAVQRRRVASATAFQAMAAWVRARPAYDTRYASLGAFDYVSRIESIELKH